MIYLASFLALLAFSAWVESYRCRCWIAQVRADVDALTRSGSLFRVEQPQIYPSKSYPWNN